VEEPQQWKKIKEIVGAALERGAAERAPFLEQACAHDESLRAEVDSLLSEYEKSSGLSEHPLSGESLDPAPVEFKFIGPYRLIRKLGEGGMGQVWLAEQTAPVRRQVALKLIRTGADDKAVLQRFQSERQSLAIMDHPSIAKVLDAGATPDGQPYFVMEYVQGVSITNYCDQHQLKIRDRLELFIKVCDGVLHAHQKAIIHRDLKPANILVVEVDGKSTPRIIDFGLAKAIGPQAAGETVFTQAGGFVGTPAYMSPEQADPRVTDLDTRTDVYSLGVVLYELLTGSLPFDPKQWQEQPLDEVLRQLREQDPPRPSTKVETEKESSTAAAAMRGTEPKQLATLLHGDLDWITMKALEKDRTRRYGTPSELAADITHYLNNQPVAARPASTSYRLRKYVHRHSVAVAVAAAFVLLLAGVAVLQAVQLRRTTRERDRANRITEFMTGMFKQSSPSEARGNSVTAREILDKASKEIDTGLTNDPELRAQMMYVMGVVYDNLGLYPRAQVLLQQAIEIQKHVLGPEHPDTLRSRSNLAKVLMDEGHFDEAEKLERRTLADERRLLGPEDPLTLETTGTLALIVQGEGHFDEGEKLAREVIEVATRRLGPESALVLASMNALSNALWSQNRYAESEGVCRQLLDIERRTLGPDHPQTLRAMSNLALAIQAQGRGTEAEPMYREALTACQRVLGPEHPLTTHVMFNLAGLLFIERRLTDAEKLYREVWAIQSRTIGPEHPDTLNSKSELADDLFIQGRVREAEKLQRETLATRLLVLGPENPRTLASQGALARTLIKEGHYVEGEKLARETFEVEIRIQGPQHLGTVFALQQLVAALAYGGRSAEASKLVHDVMERGQDSNSGGKENAGWWYAFARMAALTNHPDEALQYLREATDRGYNDADILMATDDLRNLRNNPRFRELIAELRRSSTTSRPWAGKPEQR
jgi:eukaryotic-like serine/threonine-protein kinase